MRALVIEDEKELAALLHSNLQQHGIAADLALTLSTALEFLQVVGYDVVLLDLMLPDGDGIAFLKSLRQRNNPVPVIAITARDSVADRITGLNTGADDYLVKPFAIEELVARIRAVLRRPGGPLGLVLSEGDLVFNTATREVKIRGQPVVLSRRELAILETLMRSAGRVITRDKLFNELYGFEDEPSSNAIEANVSRLRRRLKAAGSTAEIRVIRGVGYMLKAEP
jgi:DNA-binding response OmpR family regulator